MNTSLQNKPSLFTAIAVMTLINGIFNIMFGVALSIGTFLLCSPFALLLIILGGFEISYALKLLATPPQVTQPSTTIAWLEIAAVLAGNIFSAVVGILALVFYNDTTVKEYFARLNNPQTPTPADDPVTVVAVSPAGAVPSAPEPAAPSLAETSLEPVAAPVDDVPAWLKSEEAASTEAPAAPEETEAKPAKKKSPAKPRTPRKPSTKK